MTPFSINSNQSQELSDKKNSLSSDNKTKTEVHKIAHEQLGITCEPAPRSVQIPRNSISTTDQGCTFLYFPKKEMIPIGFIPDESYQNAVSQLPICCVDIFLYSPLERTYLLVLRKDPPAKGVWWLPGGRLYKEETFSDCGERKCKDELGLEVTVLKPICFASQIFPDSCWNVPTHTVSCVVFATFSQNTAPLLDKTCENYKWEPIESVPEDPYLKKAHKKAIKFISSQRFASSDSL